MNRCLTSSLNKLNDCFFCTSALDICAILGRSVCVKLGSWHFMFDYIPQEFRVIAYHDKLVKSRDILEHTDVCVNIEVVMLVRLSCAKIWWIKHIQHS